MNFDAHDFLALMAMLSVALVLSVWITVRHLSASRQARAQLVGGSEYRALAEEFRRLSDLAASGPVVLFFYPAAMTPGCTAESCHFRDMRAEFEAAGAQPVGISADPVEKQKRFTDKHSFGFPLLSDPDGTVATLFGVRRRFTRLSPTKRCVAVSSKTSTPLASTARLSIAAARASSWRSINRSMR